MKTLILMCGLPRSGKTTIARTLNIPIVNRDAIRISVHGEAYIQKAEPIVTVIEDTMVESLFRAGHDQIVIDACHTSVTRINRWLQFCRYLDHPTRVRIEVVDTNMNTCIERAKESNIALVDVILRMEGSFKNAKEFVKIEGYDKGFVIDPQGF